MDCLLWCASLLCLDPFLFSSNVLGWEGEGPLSRGVSDFPHIGIPILAFPLPAHTPLARFPLSLLLFLPFSISSPSGDSLEYVKAHRSPTELEVLHVGCSSPRALIK